MVFVVLENRVKYAFLDSYECCFKHSNFAVLGDLSSCDLHNLTQCTFVISKVRLCNSKVLFQQLYNYTFVYSDIEM